MFLYKEHILIYSPSQNAGADIVMLDNFTGDQLKVECAKLKKKYPHVIFEASGGITEASILNYVCPSVDVVSIGKLTQGYSCKDFSLKVQRESKLDFSPRKKRKV